MSPINVFIKVLLELGEALNIHVAFEDSQLILHVDRSVASELWVAPLYLLEVEAQLKYVLPLIPLNLFDLDVFNISHKVAADDFA